ncbi:MAG: helix-turn-helix transcriptional regulator [Bacteroidaceae bacterium]|nr:helix-turn-helix transcriptional regulator [Bacteroidaceae bacterium]
MIISKVIRQHGYTIEQVAIKLGLKRGSLANMIGGNPTVETLQKIADAIGASRSEFFADEGGGVPSAEDNQPSDREVVFSVSSDVKTIKIKVE